MSYLHSTFVVWGAGARGQLRIKRRLPALRLARRIRMALRLQVTVHEGGCKRQNYCHDAVV
jgi:hypothetical protein